MAYGHDHDDEHDWEGYDALKDHEGRAYTGMPVGGTHEWRYPDGRWRERKVSPDEWEVLFSSLKRRATPAPSGSGAKPGTRYHWYVLAHQRVEKLDKDRYSTLMEGAKWKVGHKRPHWARWSHEYDDQPSARQRVIRILEETLARLKAAEAAGDEDQRPLSAF